MPEWVPNFDDIPKPGAMMAVRPPVISTVLRKWPEMYRLGEYFLFLIKVYGKVYGSVG